MKRDYPSNMDGWIQGSLKGRNALWFYFPNMENETKCGVPLKEIGTSSL